MYVVVVVICLYVHCAQCTRLQSHELDESLKKFARVYMQEIKTRFADELGKILLPETTVEFNGTYANGIAKLTDGFARLNLDLDFYKGYTNQINFGKEGKRINYIYTIPEVNIEYTFSTLISSKNITGSVAFILDSQMIVATLFAQLNDSGCVYGDDNLAFVFVSKDYKAEFKIDEKVEIDKEVVQIAERALNTIYLKYMVPWINTMISDRLTNTRGYQLRNEGDEFTNKMKEALCVF